MSGAHVHLLVNHVPILGTWFGLALLLLGWARRSDEVVRAAWLTLVASAIVALPAYFSGQPAEEAIKGRPDVSELLVERHEEAADKALVAVLAVGAAALTALVATRGQRSPSRAFVATTLLLALVAGGLLGYAGSLGGQIRHAEIRPGAAPSAHQHGDDNDHEDDR